MPAHPAAPSLPVFAVLQPLTPGSASHCDCWVLPQDCGDSGSISRAFIRTALYCGHPRGENWSYHSILRTSGSLCSASSWSISACERLSMSTGLSSLGLPCGCWWLSCYFKRLKSVLSAMCYFSVEHNPPFHHLLPTAFLL